MPVKDCSTDGKPGYRWGDSGTCYPYDPSNNSSKLAARMKARKQGEAIASREGEEQKDKKASFKGGYR